MSSMRRRRPASVSLRWSWIKRMIITHDQPHQLTHTTHMRTTTTHARRQAILTTRIIQKSGEWHHLHLQSSRPELRGNEAAGTASLPLQECGGLHLQGRQAQLGEQHRHLLCQEVHHLLHPREEQSAEVHGSEAERTGRTRGCAEARIVERVVALLGRRGEAGDAAIQAGQAGAAVGQAGQGRHGGDADILPLSQVDLPRGQEVGLPRQQVFPAVPQGLWESRERERSSGRTPRRCRKGFKASARERLLIVRKREGGRLALTKE